MENGSPGEFSPPSPVFFVMEHARRLFPIFSRRLKGNKSERKPIRKKKEKKKKRKKKKRKRKKEKEKEKKKKKTSIESI